MGGEGNRLHMSLVAMPVHPQHCIVQSHLSPNEGRTLLVACLSAAMMVAEIVAGQLLGSMALLADGLHMASHTFALAIAVVAYRYARQHRADPRFTFGTGKVNALGGYTGAALLGAMAMWMAWESLERLAAPSAIQYREAMLVAVVGLAVNGASALILKDNHAHANCHGHTHAHDHNMRAAYLHVLADAATSLLAIVALAAGMYWNAPRLDPIIGLAGAVLVGWWAVGLLRDSAGVLLDQHGPDHVERKLRNALEAGGDTIEDLHCWAIAPGGYAAIVSLRSDAPQSAEFYKSKAPKDANILHLTVEVSRRLTGLKSESAA
jgi:cation diffusion facilitator family transporter